jgi:hydrogenase-4 component J
MTERVVFYQLTHKFVNQEQAIPEGPRQVIYYSLAIGHHVGVMDCFQKLMEVPVEDYSQWLDHLPEGIGRRKLAGVLKWGEIEINHSHASDLAPILQDSLSRTDVADMRWAATLIECLQKMIEEPALYLMVRKTA